MNNELKPYGEYKKSQLPWIETIPKHWNIQKAKTVYDKVNRPVREKDEVVTCFRDGKVTLRKNRRTTGFTESIKEIGYQGIRKGDLVIHVMDAFAGAIGVSDSDGKSTPVYSVCLPKIELNNYYYAHIVREMAKTGFIQSLYRGIRERSFDFRFEVFGNQLLPIPPIEEQNQIVKYLDFQLFKINKFIKAKKKLIEVLREQKQAVINEAVTKGINPDVKMKPSGIEWLGDIPEHWTKNKVSRLFKTIGSGTTPNSGNRAYYNGTIHWINSGDLNDGFLANTNKKVTAQAVEDYSVLKLFPESTIVIALYGATIGKLSITKIEACCNQACCCLGNSIVGIDIEYIFYVLLNGRKYLIEQGKGGGQPNISQDTVKQMWLPLPPIEEQRIIVEHINKKTIIIDKSISDIEKEITLITEYKTRLISDIVTGKVDVRNIVIDEEIAEETELEEIAEEETEVNEENIL